MFPIWRRGRAVIQRFAKPSVPNGPGRFNPCRLRYQNKISCPGGTKSLFWILRLWLNWIECWPAEPKVGDSNSPSLTNHYRFLDMPDVFIPVTAALHKKVLTYLTAVALFKKSCIFFVLERCPSGLRSTLGRRAQAKVCRGFESPSFRLCPDALHIVAGKPRQIRKEATVFR